MKGRWTLMAFVVLQGACTTVRSIQLDPPDEAGREVLHASTDRWTRVLVADTAFLARTGVRLNDEVLSWDSPGGRTITTRLPDVVALEHRDEVLGFFEGALGGLVVAGVVGAATHLVAGSGSSGYAPAGVVAGLVSAVVAVPVGVVIGLLRGHRFRYDAR